MIIPLFWPSTSLASNISQVASSFMAGPLVTASTSTATVEDGLSIALVSNNAEIILSMLDATITEDVDITKEAIGPGVYGGGWGVDTRSCDLIQLVFLRNPTLQLRCIGRCQFCFSRWKCSKTGSTCWVLVLKVPCRGLFAPGQVQAFTTAAAVADLSLGLQHFFK